MLKTIIENLVSDIAVRLENEYLLYEVFENGETKMIESNCFVTAPRKDEFYIIHGKDEILKTFIVQNVAHSHSSSRYAGYLFLKRVENLKI